MPKSFRPSSFFLGAATLASVLAIGRELRPPVADKWEYRIVSDVEAKELGKLSDDGWLFAGYLGRGVRGAANDETLWKRPAE